MHSGHTWDLLLEAVLSRSINRLRLVLEISVALLRGDGGSVPA